MLLHSESRFKFVNDRGDSSRDIGRVPSVGSIGSREFHEKHARQLGELELMLTSGRERSFRDKSR
jgi:hypothetical protein